MYLNFILLALASLIVLLPTYSIRNDWYAKNLEDDRNISVLLAYREAVERHFDTHYSYPNSLNDLNTEERLPNGELVLYRKTQVNDKTDHIRYEKYILATSNNHNPITPEFLKDNKCGSKAFIDGEDFCGNSNAYWMINDSKAKIRALTSLQSQRLNSTALRFFENPQFPTTSTGKTMALSDAVGTVDCYQPNTFKSVSLSCLDIYNVTNSDVFYQNINATHSILFSMMPFTDENGQKHIVAKELKK